MGGHDDLEAGLELERAQRERTGQAAYAVRLEDALRRLYAATWPDLVAVIPMADNDAAVAAVLELAGAREQARRVLPGVVMGERPPRSA